LISIHNIKLILYVCRLNNIAWYDNIISTINNILIYIVRYGVWQGIITVLCNFHNIITFSSNLYDIILVVLKITYIIKNWIKYHKIYVSGVIEVLLVETKNTNLLNDANK